MTAQDRAVARPGTHGRSLRVRDAVYPMIVGSIVGSIVYVWLAVDHVGGLEAFADADIDDIPVSPLLWSIAVTSVIELVWVGLVLFGREAPVTSILGLSVDPEDLLLGVALYVAVLVGGIVVLGFLLPAGGVETDGYQSQFPSTLAESSELQIVAFIGLVAFLVPLVEEILFRGVVLRALEAAWGGAVAVLGSSVLFGLAHAATFTEADVPIIAFTATMGLIVGSSVLYTNRLTPAVIAHSLNNLVVALVIT